MSFFDRWKGLVQKHGDHDQKSHGNWANGITPEAAEEASFWDRMGEEEVADRHVPREHRNLDPYRNGPSVTAYPKEGSPEWLKAKSTGPLMEYKDGRGVTRQGYMGTYSDRGGTDHTAYMYDKDTGELSLVSGSNLKAMRNLRR